MSRPFPQKLPVASWANELTSSTVVEGKFLLAMWTTKSCHGVCSWIQSISVEPAGPTNGVRFAVIHDGLRDINRSIVS